MDNINIQNICLNYFSRFWLDFCFAMAHYNRGITYYLKKDYENAWNDIYKVQELGIQVHPSFLKVLKEDSGLAR